MELEVSRYPIGLLALQK